MNKIFKFSDYNTQIEIIDVFLDRILNPTIKESLDNDTVKSILSGLQKDLKFNTRLIFTFGTGITAMYPIVNSLIKNQNLKVDLNKENIILLTLTSIVILYMELKNTDEIGKSEIKFLLNELKLRGIGNGIVKKIVNCLKSIGNLLHVIFKGTGKSIINIFDIFAYTSLMIPTMNAINSIISDYNWNIDTVMGNLISIGTGIGTLAARGGIQHLVKKLSKIHKINSEIKDITKNVDGGELKTKQVNMINEQ